jgi:hypothetical protein
MAEKINGAVVTEGMLTEAARAGNLESLTVWARQSVRVTSGEPLFIAAQDGQLEVLRLLVQKLGADVNETHHGIMPLIIAAEKDNLAVVRCLVELGADVNQVMYGDTPLIIAAGWGHLHVLRCLIQAGARIGAVDSAGNTALLDSACFGRYATMQYLLEEAGASMDDVNNKGHTVWGLLTEHLTAVARGGGGAVDPSALPGLLRVLVLRDAPPPALVALLSPEQARVVQEGARLRARLPAYLAHRRAYLDSRCPRISLLPGVLRALIYTFEGSATTEELWATGLGSLPCF